MSKEAMTLALDALQNSIHLVDGEVNHEIAIKALEEALAKQEQDEPVAWDEDQAYAWGRGCYEIAQAAKTEWKLFGQLTPKEQAYWVAKAAFEQAKPQPSQKPWVGLTNEEIKSSKPPLSNDAVVWSLAIEWAETKLKEKNNG